MFLQTIATAAPAGAAQPPAGSPLQFVPIILMVAIFYFALIRPQRRREKERKAMIEAVKSGSRVLLTSGILGEVCNVKDRTLIVRIAEKTKIEVLKSAVSQIVEEKGELPSEVQA